MEDCIYTRGRIIGRQKLPNHYEQVTRVYFLHFTGCIVVFGDDHWVNENAARRVGYLAARHLFEIGVFL